MIPDEIPPSILEKAAGVVHLSTRLNGMAHPASRATIREFVRSMNSFYSNRIEGQSTHPLNIERALRKEFSDRPDVARLQRVALAHIEAEKELDERVGAGESPMTSTFLIAAHHALYSRLEPADLVTEEGRVIVPGKVREENVQIARHIPPTAESLPRFLGCMDAAYERTQSWGMHLIVVACLHHRAAWVHPFLDGNGRAARLQSLCALWQLSGGLWSPCRGLSRAVADYYARLHNADAPRRGDLDGCGSLTAAGLLDWIDFFLDICQDQVRFMDRMLDLDGMKKRIEALITLRAAYDKTVRAEAILPLYHVFAAGPVTRGEFTQMTGLGERTARSLISRLLRTGLLASDSPYGPVRWALPLDALHILFPGLYPEVDARGE